MMKLAFCGTPDFAVPTLQRLASSPEHHLLGVICQPDRPGGRGMKVQAPPVKIEALRLGLPVEQPARSADILSILERWQPDALVVVAYGKLFRPEVIHRWPCLNVHASLLPKYRGAAPIQNALLNGEPETGVTIMLLAEQMDVGDMLMQGSVDIAPDETAGELHDRLAPLGAELLLKTLAEIQAHGMDRLKIAQNHSCASYCKKIEKQAAQIDWSQTPPQIHNHVRAYTPWPGAFTVKDGVRVKVLKTRVADGRLQILEVQPEGKKAMCYEDYLRGGYPALTNDRVE